MLMLTTLCLSHWSPDGAPDPTECLSVELFRWILAIDMLAVDIMKALDIVKLDKVLEKVKNQRSYQESTNFTDQGFTEVWCKMCTRMRSITLGWKATKRWYYREMDKRCLGDVGWDVAGSHAAVSCRRVSPISKLSCRLPRSNCNIENWRKTLRECRLTQAPLGPWVVNAARARSSFRSWHETLMLSRDRKPTLWKCMPTQAPLGPWAV